LKSTRSKIEVAEATANFLGAVAMAAENETFVPSAPPPSRPSDEFMGAEPEKGPSTMNDVRAAQALIFQRIQAADSSAINQIADVGLLVARLLGKAVIPIG
jgi:hypothetical protein